MTVRNDLLAPNGRRFAVVRTRGSYNARDMQLVAVETLAGAFTVNLPAPGNAGTCIAVGDDADNAAANAIRVEAASGNIDGGSFYDITRNGAIELFLDDGDEWKRVQAPRFIYDARTGQTIGFVALASLVGGASSSDFGSQDIETTGAALLGPTATPRATEGRVRVSQGGGATGIIVSRNALDTGNLYLVHLFGDDAWYGQDHADGRRVANAFLGATTSAGFRVAGADSLVATNAIVRLANGYAFVHGTTNPATTGDHRVRNGFAKKGRNAANSANVLIHELDTSNYLWLGDNAGNTEATDRTHLRANNQVHLGVQGGSYVVLDSQELGSRVPIVGYDVASSPYGVHGSITHAFAADANYVVTAAQYKYYRLQFDTGVITAGRTVTFPAPSSEARAYTKFIHNNTPQTLTMTTGAGATIAIATTVRRLVRFGTDGATIASPVF